ncbi:hypothetical protein A9Q84_08065 [Halobacteriovorax marinus]|uniref:Uncharacterized protein n=1 Tax=Halobacteriovorax marinus TaxID=97084 RepID=A0A1Y5F5Y4_9BACT|nr:hypothetical protein A9Q84_08065 [Halobacteriovorax marinus]
MNISCPVSLGELVDKISILKIKTKNINDVTKVAYAQNEFDLLMEKLNDLNLEGITSFLDELIGVNSELWKIEDDIRDLERQKLFEKEFIDLARAVYVTNDRRFAVKNRINEFFGSVVKEVKSYEEY